MKFRFNGDADCPDWILAEIYTLSQLSSIKFKQLGQIIVQGIQNPPVQMDKVNKLFADSKLDENIDLQACVSCLMYIISAAVKYNCNSSALQSELQQLGLPREHSVSIKRVFDQHHDSLTKYCKSTSLKVNPLESISGEEDIQTETATLHLQINNSTERITVSPAIIDDLLKDLINIKNRMVELQDAL